MYKYFFTFRTQMREKWLGYTLLSLFTKFFPSRPSSYYEEAIRLGVIKINGKIQLCDYQVTINDLIEHTIHYHEPRLYSLEILEVEDDYIIVNKPAGIACHPTGGYHKYTLTNFLYETHFKGRKNFKEEEELKREKEHLVQLNYEKFSKENLRRIIQIKNDLKGRFKLGCVNRLDVLTSGIVIITYNEAKRYHKMIEGKKIEKIYIAKVKGQFNEEEVICDGKIKKYGILSRVEDGGKESLTHFKRLSYDGEYSLIECKPISGRSHQIRVHLKYLGFPILYDPIYNNDIEDIRQLDDIHELSTFKQGICKCESQNEAEKFMIYNCMGDNTKSNRNKDKFICLHAYTYTIGSKIYKCTLPSWAK